MSSINKLTLAKNLTARVNGLCSGLENGTAEILNLVSDTTAELLRWWFQQDYMDMRPFNFHEGQKQAILNTLYAHEVLGVKTLKDLYAEIAPDVVLGSHHAAHIIRADKNDYPKYCMKMATGTGKTWRSSPCCCYRRSSASRPPSSRCCSSWRSRSGSRGWCFWRRC